MIHEDFPICLASLCLAVHRRVTFFGGTEHPRQRRWRVGTTISASANAGTDDTPTRHAVGGCCRFRAPCPAALHRRAQGPSPPRRSGDGVVSGDRLDRSPFAHNGASPHAAPSSRHRGDQPHECVLVGDESLLIECGRTLLRRRWGIAAVVSSSPAVSAWARANDLPLCADPARPAEARRDWRC